MVGEHVGKLHRGLSVGRWPLSHLLAVPTRANKRNDQHRVAVDAQVQLRTIYFFVVSIPHNLFTKNIFFCSIDTATLFSLFLTAEAMHFLAIGDWGGSSDSKPVTGAEKDNANGMAATAVALGGIRFVLGEGDNFWRSWRRALSALHRWLRERFPAARAPGPVLRNRWQS